LAQHFSRFNLQAPDSIVRMVGIARAPVVVLVLGTVGLLVAQVLGAIRTRHLRLRTRHLHQFIQPHQRANQGSQGFVQCWIGIKVVVNFLNWPNIVPINNENALQS
jgi:hypothetical protein